MLFLLEYEVVLLLSLLTVIMVRPTVYSLAADISFVKPD